MARTARTTEVNECRQCSTFCDRVIRPATCVAAACPGLYQYDDPLTGRRFMGCLQKVYAVEIDLDLLRAAEALFLEEHGPALPAAADDDDAHHRGEEQERLAEGVEAPRAVHDDAHNLGVVPFGQGLGDGVAGDAGEVGAFPGEVEEGHGQAGGRAGHQHGGRQPPARGWSLGGHGAVSGSPSSPSSDESFTTNRVLPMASR